MPKLKVAELNALLALKAIEIPKGSKKPELVELAKKAMQLPSSAKPPALQALPALSNSKELLPRVESGSCAEADARDAESLAHRR